MKQTDAIVVSRVRTRDSELTSLAPGGCKPMIQVNGRPAVAHLVESLKRCELISRVIVVGDVLRQAQDEAAGADVFVDGSGDEADAVLAGIRAAAGASRCLVMAGDMPLVTQEAVRDLLDCAPDAGVVYPVASRADAEAAFPGRRWPCLVTREGEYTGSSCLLFRPDAVLSKVDMVVGLLRARKDPAALVKLIGLRAGLKLMLSKPSLCGLESVLSDALGLDCRVFITHYPEILFSIDAPGDVETAEIALG